MDVLGEKITQSECNEKWTAGQKKDLEKRCESMQEEIRQLNIENTNLRMRMLTEIDVQAPLKENKDLLGRILVVEDKK